MRGVAPDSASANYFFLSGFWQNKIGKFGTENGKENNEITIIRDVQNVHVYFSKYSRYSRGGGSDGHTFAI